MKNTVKFISSFLFLIIIFMAFYPWGRESINEPFYADSLFARKQIALDVNNISTWFWNTGVFNYDLRTWNVPGFMWPKGSGKFAIFSTGLTIGAYYNGSLRLAAALYFGEFVPGYCTNGTLHTDTTFKLYRVKRTDNMFTNPDWANWGFMVPFGAPFTDVNNNGTYEPQTDIPGVHEASQTIFICMTDADSNNHVETEGFYGATAPLFAQVQLTAWAYEDPRFTNVQFLKWVVINKSPVEWDSTRISIAFDPDLGDMTDDYVGCDTARKLGFCYNADNFDGDGTGYSYGANPPSSGIMLLNCAGPNTQLKSFSYFKGDPFPPLCENGPTSSQQTFNYLSGFKNDRTPWINILSNQATKFCYTGDPETNTGWNEFQGRIDNCNGSLTGQQVIPAPPGDRKFVMTTTDGNTVINQGDTTVIVAAQLIARGSDHKNSVTLLKQLSDSVKVFCQNGFVIGIKQISNLIPGSYTLYQNYPNPFNPVTKIKFDIPAVGQRHVFDVRLAIYDVLGKQIAVLVNEKLNTGTYEADWDAINYPSGVYFYKLVTDEYSETKKMVLLK